MEKLKLLTRNNVLNILLFAQALIVYTTDNWVFSDNIEKGISLVLFIIGYFINIDFKQPCKEGSDDN